MLHENDIVPSSDLTAGSIGTIVMVYKTDSTNSEYEVEFVDEDGHTLALLTLKEDDIESVHSAKAEVWAI